MNYQIIFARASAALAVLMTLPGCGGGGGGSGGGAAVSAGAPASTPAPSPSPTPAPTPSPSSSSALQTSVPAPTYPANSQELAAFVAVNDFRQSLGLGLWAQEPHADTAAANHLNYLLTNNLFSHFEDASKPGFTGVDPVARAFYAGYPGGGLSEEIGGGGQLGGAEAIKELVGTLYHRMGLMVQAQKDVGIAVGNDQAGTLVIEFGYYQTPQSNASDYLGGYPVDGQTNVPRFMISETPNPFPDLNPNNADYPTKTSYPISIVSVVGSVLGVSSFTVTESGQSTPLSARLATHSTDPEIDANTAWLVGNAPFNAGTTYQVSFAGTVNGAPVSKNWRFATTSCGVYQSYIGC